MTKHSENIPNELDEHPNDNSFMGFASKRILEELNKGVVDTSKGKQKFMPVDVYQRALAIKKEYEKGDREFCPDVQYALEVVKEARKR